MNDNSDVRIAKPHRMIGCTLLLSASLLLAVLFIAIMVKRPNTVDGNVTMVSNCRPYEMIAPQTGKLILLRPPGDTIERGIDMAYIYKSICYNSIASIYEAVKSRNLECIYSCLCDTSITNGTGDLAVECGELRLALYQWLNFDRVNQLQAKVNLMKAKDSAFCGQYRIETEIFNYESVAECQMDLTCHEDSLLFRQGHISRTQLNQSAKEALSQKHKVETIKSSMLTLRHDMTQNMLELDNLIDELTIKRDVLRQDIEAKVSNLLSAIEIWRSQNVIVAPQSGRFELFPNVSDGQMVMSGVHVIRSLPFDDGKLKGDMLFDLKESGNLKGGESVKITLDSYPSSQYGYLLGVVEHYSSVFTDQSSMSHLRSACVSVDMSNQPYWWTDLNYVHGMTGKAEIIVEDKSLLERMLNFIVVNMN